MGVKSKALGTEKIPTFGKTSKGSFGKKKTKWNNKGTKRKTTDKELEYLNWCKEQDLKCIVCNSNNTQLHHIKRNSSDKKDHTKIIPLCLEHHIGNKISPHGAKENFFKRYPWEWQKRYSETLYKKYEQII